MLFLQVGFKWDISQPALAITEWAAAAQWSPCAGSNPNGCPTRDSTCWDRGACAAEGWPAHPAGIVWHWKYSPEKSWGNQRVKMGDLLLFGYVAKAWEEVMGQLTTWRTSQGWHRETMYQQVETVAWGKTSTSFMTGLACTSGKGTQFLGCIKTPILFLHLCLTEYELGLCH